MALHKGIANQGKSNHKSKPTSKLSKHEHKVKPHTRETGAKMNVSAAEAFVNKIHR